RRLQKREVAMSNKSSPTALQDLPAPVARACREINALVDKLATAERKVEQYQIAIGQHIAAIKKTRPNDWQQVIEVECKLKRSRAYELLAIASGTKTVEQTRAQTNIRKIKHRESVRSGTDGSTLVAAIDEGAADSDAAAVTRPRRTKHESYLEGIRT